MLIIDEIFRPSLRNLRVILAVIHVNNTDLFWWRIFANILNDLSKMLRPIFKHFLPILIVFVVLVRVKTNDDVMVRHTFCKFVVNV